MTKNTAPKAKLTPLMKQYFEVKRKHPDAILLFRVGDFYETFGEDAVKASQILGIVLTSRNNGGSDIELAGFPHHSVELYLPKLVKAGYRVAVCEQLEKPSKEKKIVKRDVTEVVTPGVTTNDSLLDASQNNFLCSVILKGSMAGLAFLDISTGEFFVHEGSMISCQKLVQSFNPNELLYSKAQKSEINRAFGLAIYSQGLDEWFFEYDYNRELLLKHFKMHSLKGFGIESNQLGQIAAGTIMQYLSSIEQKQISHIHKIVRLESDRYMWLDKFTVRNLELLRSNHESGKSLLDVLDQTVSPMGARLLSRWVVLPLKTIEEIRTRQDCVAELIDNTVFRDDLGQILKSVGDLERLASKIPPRKINPRELLHISISLEKVAQLKALIQDHEQSQLNEIVDRLDDCAALKERIDNTVSPDAPMGLNKPGIIKDGWNEELDDWRSVSRNSKEILLDLQKKEAERTGISGLKVGFNNVFGYYFEVTNKYKNQDLIPDDWVRKQTLKASERYINDELKTIETKILQAEERIIEMEEVLYKELTDFADSYIASLLSNAQILGEIDCYNSFAISAIQYDYVKPEINDSYSISIKDGRHPVIERQLPAEHSYVPNDLELDLDNQQIILITGPNMSGKSAVLRQTALICLMAHIGSYVPAKAVRLGIVDKIFTRVGASDNISSGESTFMVEMNETASILNNLSKRSLIILDEIGRGTSTYDGISIAWAIAEFLHSGPSEHPKTLFATHYHELSELEDNFERIKNFNVSTKEIAEKVIFLRKLVPGTCASSFGIHVAQMAGMPNEIVVKAKMLLEQLESKSINDKGRIREDINSVQASSALQMQLFDDSNKLWFQIKGEIEKLDLSAMTPIECMLKLKEIQEKLNEEQ